MFVVIAGENCCIIFKICDGCGLFDVSMKSFPMIDAVRKEINGVSMHFGPLRLSSQSCRICLVGWLAG